MSGSTLFRLGAPIERSAERDAALRATLPHVAFSGWTEASLRAGLADAGEDPDLAPLMFPGGGVELAEYFSDWADRAMAAELAGRDLPSLRIRERVALAVRVRLEVVHPWREAVGRAIALMALPTSGPVAARILARTVNAVWHACGDRSADFSWYTKRALLAGVYTATVLYWLRDESEECEASWAFLGRRIDGVMQIMRARHTVEQALSGLKLPDPFGLLGRRRHPV